MAVNEWAYALVFPAQCLCCYGMPITESYYSWHLVGKLLLQLLVFTGVVALLVFILRRPLRQYKAADLAFFQKINAWRNPANNRIMLAITFLGSHHFLIPANIVVMVIFMLVKNPYHYTVVVSFVSLSSLLLMFFFKRLFRRSRPDKPLLFEAKGKSFPSGHAMMSVAFYGLLLHMIRFSGINPVLFVVLAVVLIIVIIAIGCSRVYLQVHYASDVLVGWIVGSCWLYLCLEVVAVVV